MNKKTLFHRLVLFAAFSLIGLFLLNSLVTFLRFSPLYILAQPSWLKNTFSFDAITKESKYTPLLKIIPENEENIFLASADINIFRFYLYPRSYLKYISPSNRWDWKNILKVPAYKDHEGRYFIVDKNTSNRQSLIEHLLADGWQVIFTYTNDEYIVLKR